MWSIIVFSDECTFKDVKISSDKQFRVIQLHQLKSVVNKLIKQTKKDLFSYSDVQWMYDELHPFTNKDELEKNIHIETLYKNKKR